MYDSDGNLGPVPSVTSGRMDSLGARYELGLLAERTDEFGAGLGTKWP